MIWAPCSPRVAWFGKTPKRHQGTRTRLPWLMSRSNPVELVICIVLSPCWGWDVSGLHRFVLHLISSRRAPWVHTIGLVSCFLQWPLQIRTSSSSLAFGSIGIGTLRATVTADGPASSFVMIFTGSPTPSVTASSLVMRFIREATSRLRRFTTSFTTTMAHGDGTQFSPHCRVRNELPTAVRRTAWLF